MKHALFILSLLSCTSLCAEPDVPVRPDSFAQHTLIHLNGSSGGPFHQFVLPIEVYQSIQRDDLGDLRIFNGQGEVVPYALLYPESTSISHTKEIKVPLFPIMASAEHRDDTSIEVRRNSDGTLIAFKQSSSPQSKTSYIRGTLLDVSQVQDDIYSLRLEVGPTTVPFHPFILETSDDLQRWHTLKTDAQIVRLQHAEQHIEKSTVEWNGHTGKYLRVLWTEPEQAPAITAAFINTLHTTLLGTSTVWSDSLVPTTSQKNTYDYILPGRIPLDQIRINLAQLNTLAPAQLQKYIPETTGRRHHTPGTWVTLTNTVLFRLQSPHGDITSPDITLHTPAEKYLRLFVDERGGGLGSTPPTLQIGFTPHTLVFLPRGNGPFTLAWGASAIHNAALSAETLIPQYHTDQPLNASPATLEPITLTKSPNLSQGDIALNASETEKKVSRHVLWAVLMGGVLVLGGMAWKLIAQMQQGKN